jgi:hypothetical protein
MPGAKTAQHGVGSPAGTSVEQEQQTNLSGRQTAATRMSHDAAAGNPRVCGGFEENMQRASWSAQSISNTNV